VIPDAYNLEIEFKSCLANNLNTSVFQYYVEMSEYDNGGVNSEPPGSESKTDGYAKTKEMFFGKVPGSDIKAEPKPQDGNAGANNGGAANNGAAS